MTYYKTDDRECGDCNVCCVVGAVPELEKPAHTPCKFIKTCKSGSCSIFKSPELPSTCKTYDCAWKQGFGGPYEKPSVNNVLFTVNKLENQVYITAIELAENAIRKPDGLGGAFMAMDMAMETNIPIIVVKYGVKPPYDTGDWVIITEKTLPRCSMIAGKEVHRYTDDIAMYELIKGK